MENNNAGSQLPVEKSVDGAKAQSPIAPEVDYAAVIAAKDAELEKTRQDRDNYRKGLLKAKGKYEEQDEPDESQEEMFRRIAREEFAATREAQLISEKDSLIKQALKENAELKTAIRNRSNMVSAAGSAGPENEPMIDNFFSSEQLAYFKEKGWDKAKIERYKKNLQEI